MKSEPDREHASRRPKAERKEQARLEREAIQRRMARRQRNRTIGIGARRSWRSSRPPSHSARFGDRRSGPPARIAEPTATGSSRRADRPAASARLEQIRRPPGTRTRPTSERRDPFDSCHPLGRYPSVPPTSGPHAVTTLGSRRVRLPAGRSDRPDPFARARREPSIWYDPDASGEASRPHPWPSTEQNDPAGQDRVIVAPYDYPDAGERRAPATRHPDGARRLAPHCRPARSRASRPRSTSPRSTRSRRSGRSPYQGEAPEAAAARRSDHGEQEAAQAFPASRVRTTSAGSHPAVGCDPRDDGNARIRPARRASGRASRPRGESVTRRGLSLFLAAGASASAWCGSSTGRAARPSSPSRRRRSPTDAECTGPVEVAGRRSPRAVSTSIRASRPTTTHRPATSGVHAPAPLPTDPNVFDATRRGDPSRALHGALRGSSCTTGKARFPQEVVDRLASVANGDRNTLLAPYPELRPTARTSPFATWNRLLTCPSDVTAAQAGYDRPRIHRRLRLHVGRTGARRLPRVLRPSARDRSTRPPARARDRTVLEGRRPRAGSIPRRTRASGTRGVRTAPFSSRYTSETTPHSAKAPHRRSSSRSVPRSNTTRPHSIATGRGHLARSEARAVPSGRRTFMVLADRSRPFSHTVTSAALVVGDARRSGTADGHRCQARSASTWEPGRHSWRRTSR